MDEGNFWIKDVEQRVRHAKIGKCDLIIYSPEEAALVMSIIDNSTDYKFRQL